MDNELPAISALRDEESPPPVESTTFTRFRIKLPRRSNPIPNQIGTASEVAEQIDRSPYATQDFDSVNNEDEAEEDQLIDDDDLPTTLPSTARTSQHVAKPPPAKKPRVRKNKAAKDKDAVFMVSTFELAPTPATQATTTEDSWAPIQTCVPPVEAKPSKRRGQAKKDKPTLGRPRKTRVTQSSAMQAHYRDDDGSSITSEAIANTVASSPQPFEVDNAESEQMPGVNDPPHALYPEHETTIDPETEPIPIWPLPTRVFPVQNLPKIPTGNAPAQPLEKKAPAVRQWRQAQREIRGIAGGRWFVRSWIGDRDSEYASWKASGNGPPPTLPATTKKLKFLKPDTGDRNSASVNSTPGVAPEVFIVQQS